MRIWPLLLLGACAAATPTPDADHIDCTTPCGLHVLTTAAACPHALATEARLLSAVSLRTSISAADLCAAVNGWTVISHGPPNVKDQLECNPGGWWQGICVSGYTFDKFKLVETMNEDWTHNALAHELIHVWSLYKFHVEGHCGWYERGILRALQDVTGLWDYTRPEADCPEASGQHGTK